MKKQWLWLTIGIIGIALAVVDLIARFGFGRDSLLGLHVHLTTIVGDQASQHDFVIPALVGAVIALSGFVGFYITRHRRLEHL